MLSYHLQDRRFKLIYRAKGRQANTFGAALGLSIHPMPGESETFRLDGLQLKPAPLIQYTNKMEKTRNVMSEALATNTRVDGKFFTFTEVRGVLTKFPQNFTLTKATLNEFPALNGQSVSYAVLQFPADGLNPPLVLLNSCS
ncbi:hypothetical protein OIU85_006856 [Salix viminalis]|uniref:Uncharacterized protein n=1 Tax=Salix viminalis TaxID=40686 RepID=A0A9Q0SUX8_SALVM|nr:hypothetical protein OIU85_006856 [Salix viminalis]